MGAGCTNPKYTDNYDHQTNPFGHYSNVNDPYLTRIVSPSSSLARFQSKTVVPILNNNNMMYIDNNLESFILIWLDAELDETNNDDLRQLKRIVNSLKTYDNVKDCINYILSIDGYNERVLLIISGSFGKRSMSDIHDIAQIDFIYIFSPMKTKYEELTKQYKKIQGIYDNIDILCNKLKHDVSTRTNDLMISNITDDEHLNENTTFFSFYFILETFLNMTFHPNIRKSLVEYCQLQYIENENELKIINEFNKNYQSNKCIWWYTRNCFLYRILNKSFRIMDLNIIFKLRFFIIDMYKQLKQLHYEQYIKKSSLLKNMKILIVYREQGITKNELKILKENIGGLLSINYFMLTTLDKHVHIHSSHHPDTEKILFQIYIDIEKCTQPFANIEQLSYFNLKSEILISIGSLFRIKSIKKEIDWFVKLELITSEEENKLKQMFIDKNNIGQHLRDMDGQEKREEYTEVLSQNVQTDGIDIADDYYNNGTRHLNEGDYIKSLENFEKALSIYEKYLDSDDQRIAKTYSSIGMTHGMQGDFVESLTNYKRALNVYKTSIQSPNYKGISKTYNNIAMAHYAENEHDQALVNLEKAVEIDQREFSKNDPFLITSYTNMALVYSEKHEFRRAIDYYNKALIIQLENLPKNHADLAPTYGNIGTMYDRLGDHTQALQYYQKALETQLIALPLNDPNLADTYMKIGNIYYAQRNYPKALENFSKASDICAKLFPPDAPQIIELRRNITAIQNSLHHK
ncbi:unnamed protein product [Didymodactylos carnosus]|uniref:Uncharacterized protein n=2 Tax=Didymodactylos carnosus TaxID=1234261 RepID=A0A815AFH5_9BILA|nr:unnamed protein product [Didymodactylos carnosus]CAF4030596.1 unnamed protein product [Didymodactylos carnosus]